MTEFDVRFYLIYAKDTNTFVSPLYVYDREKVTSFPVANLSEIDMDYNLYLVSVDSHTGWDVAVFAANDQEAIDAVIDFAEDEGYEGWLLDDVDKADIEHEGFLDEYWHGGNHGLYLSEPAASCRIMTIAEANGQ